MVRSRHIVRAADTAGDALEIRRMKPIPNPLTVRALKLFGPNERNAAHWLRAVRYLRRNGKWIADGAKPKWGIKKEAA
jgi:polyphosphate kinase 2 (PPK2 family)